jgi:diguanylate cyclase (GGDEF)-like protein/PAS domain S-box-containing protein
MTEPTPSEVDASVLRELADACPDGMAMLQGDSPLEAAFVWANEAMERFLLPGGGSVVGRSLPALAGDEPDAAAAISEACRWGDAVVRRRTSAFVARVRPATPVLGRVGPVRWCVTVSSTATSGLADEAMRASEERFRALAENVPMGVFFSEVGLRLGYVNDRFAELWGQPVSAVVGMGWLDSVHEDDRPGLLDALSAVLIGEPFDKEVRLRRADELRWLRARAVPVSLPGHGAGFVGSIEDVTESRRHEEQLAHQATHDPLTGLPNRVLLAPRLEDALARAPVALLFFDLDDFKLVNDTFGHVVGDDLLVTVAARLTDGVRPDDMVVRLGGDEFVVLCHVATTEDATRMAERLRTAVSRPAVLDGTEVAVSASVGVVLAEGRQDAEGLLRDADVAMYQAKQAGKARCAVFDERVRTGLQERLNLSGDLRRALAGDALSVVYQPIWDVTGAAPRAVAVEALVRWRHAVRGDIPAAQLVTLAQDSGQIDQLGEFVLRRACQDLATWRRADPALGTLAISVNVSTPELRNGRLLDRVHTALTANRLRGADLWLELAETVATDGVDGARATLAELRAIGVQLAVDDFGTGYSSLAYLRRLPVQAVKIDRAFVGHLDTSDGDAAIVGAVVAVANALGLTAVAEGVERPEQLDALVRLGCAQAQGFLLGAPVPASEVLALLAAGTLAPPAASPSSPGRAR